MKVEASSALYVEDTQVFNIFFVARPIGSKAGREGQRGSSEVIWVVARHCYGSFEIQLIMLRYYFLSHLIHLVLRDDVESSSKFVVVRSIQQNIISDAFPRAYRSY